MSGCAGYLGGFTPPPPGPPVVFDWTFFQARYPELTSPGQTQIQLYFNEGCMICDNTGAGPVPNYQGGQMVANPSGSGLIVNPLYVALHALAAHITFLNGSIGGPGVPNSTLVGRIASAGEGSVNVSAEYRQPTSNMEAWCNQTKYGAAYWAMVQQYKWGRATYRGGGRYAAARTWP